MIFGFLATTVSLGILAAYILVVLSGIIFFLRSLLCGATMYSSVIPVPPPPLNLAPYIAATWLILGLILLAVLKGHVVHISGVSEDSVPESA